MRGLKDVAHTVFEKIGIGSFPSFFEGDAIESHTGVRSRDNLRTFKNFAPGESLN